MNSHNTHGREMGQALGMCGGGGGGNKPPPQGQEVTVWEAPGKVQSRAQQATPPRR